MFELWMEQAMNLAEKAAEIGEVPVGAVVVLDNEVIGRGFNRSIVDHDPSAHAEIQAIRDAAQRVENYRLPESTLVVTLEPCTMCAGALVHARIAHLVFGAREPKAGAIVSTQSALSNPSLNHRVQVTAGVREAECSAMLSSFFKERRR